MRCAWIVRTCTVLIGAKYINIHELSWSQLSTAMADEEEGSRDFLIVMYRIYRKTAMAKTALLNVIGKSQLGSSNYHFAVHVAFVQTTYGTVLRCRDGSQQIDAT